jgi:hypothetical protein
VPDKAQLLRSKQQNEVQNFKGHCIASLLLAAAAAAAAAALLALANCSAVDMPPGTDTS